MKLGLEQGSKFNGATAFFTVNVASIIGVSTRVDIRHPGNPRCRARHPRLHPHPGRRTGHAGLLWITKRGA